MTLTELKFDATADELTCNQLRGRIAHKCGLRPPASTLGKAILNSVHAYLTGEFAVAPARLHRTKRRVIVRDTLVAVMNHPAYPPDDPAEMALADYAFDADTARALHRDELVEVFSTLDDAEDAREWV